jgi:hypothetical protein
MSSAKFLSVAALWLGLATYAALSQAAQPASDYDLEPLLRRYGGESNQVISPGDDLAPEATPPSSKHTADSNSDKNSSGRLLPASCTSADDDSTLCDQKEPALLPSSTGAWSTLPAPKSTSDWPANTVHRGVKQAMANSSTAYSSGVADDSTYPQPASIDSATRSVQMPRPLSSKATGVRETYVGDTDNRAGGVNNSAQPTPEIISSGTESPNCSEGLACNSNCDCDSCFNPCGCPGWYGGADYLFVRPRFSNAQAYDQQVRTTVAPLVFTDTIVQQKFDYQSSVRAFFGYRFNCGDEIHFTYWNYENNGSVQSPLTPGAGALPEVFYGGQFMVRAGNPGSGPNQDGAGDSVLSTYGLTMNVYDIDYSKCCCGCGSCGCNSCGCGNCCPVWTVKYSLGVRIADVRRYDNSFEAFPADPSPTPTAGYLSASFIGAGPKVGLEARRYFRGNQFSLFARTDFSLLLGEYDTTQTAVNPGVSTQIFTNNNDRIIPVAGIEMGGDWQVADNLKLSAGYLFQAWWDLGAYEQLTLSLPQVGNSNILGFDGLFARIEYDF